VPHADTSISFSRVTCVSRGDMSGSVARVTVVFLMLTLQVLLVE
jgi:hypothetical protein